MISDKNPIFCIDSYGLVLYIVCSFWCIPTQFLESDSMRPSAGFEARKDRVSEKKGLRNAARGNPVKIRNCPAAVSGNEHRHEALVREIYPGSDG
jgi:hypothetical protein